MRIGFVENLARQSMAAKGWTRAKALRRHGILWAVLAAICAGIWAFAPIEKLTFERRGTAVPLPFLMAGMAVMLAAMSALTFLSLLRRDPP